MAVKEDFQRWKAAKVVPFRPKGFEAEPAPVKPPKVSPYKSRVTGVTLRPCSADDVRNSRKGF